MPSRVCGCRDTSADMDVQATPIGFKKLAKTHHLRFYRFLDSGEGEMAAKAKACDLRPSLQSGQKTRCDWPGERKDSQRQEKRGLNDSLAPEKRWCPGGICVSNTSSL